MTTKAQLLAFWERSEAMGSFILDFLNASSCQHQLADGSPGCKEAFKAKEWCLHCKARESLTGKVEK